MKYKLFIYSLLLSFLLVPKAASAQMDEVWDEANRAYTAGDYLQAIVLYDSIEHRGYTSAKLFYNLGNAYFKEARIGPAILYYNKAQRLDPGNADIRHNLLIAGTRVRDRIDAVPEFFLKTWARQAMLRLGSDAWAVWSLVFFALALAAVLLYLLGNRLMVRKTGFYSAIVCLLLFIGTLAFSTIQRRKIVHPDEAVVMITAAPVKTEPNASARDAFVLHEGTKVRIVGEMASWREIVLADGNQGWIDEASIAPID